MTFSGKDALLSQSKKVFFNHISKKFILGDTAHHQTQMTANLKLCFICQKFNSHSFIMPMSMQRFRRQAWQWRRLSFVMVQLPLNGQVKEALRFMLRLLEQIQNE